MTIRETIMNVVARQQHKVFLLDATTGREITYGEFHRQACNLAAELQRSGVRKGNRIAVMVPNCCELAVLYFCSLFCGVISVVTNTSSAQTECLIDLVKF